jgi:hypothetical protein
MIFFLAPIFINSNVLSFFPQGEGYINDQQGTWKAFLLPLFTLVICLLIFNNFRRVFNKNQNNKILIFINDSKSLIYSLIFFSIGITPFIVTAATRYLELVHLLLLIAGVAMSKKSYINFIGFLLLILVLVYLNIEKNLWLNMFYPI